VRLHEPCGGEFGELGFEGGTVGAGEGDGFGVGEGFSRLEEGGELAGERGELRAAGVEAVLEAGDLMADAAEEKQQPSRPVGGVFAPGRLRAAESEVVGRQSPFSSPIPSNYDHFWPIRATSRQAGRLAPFF
jgi:hypothetical protein